MTCVRMSSRRVYITHVPNVICFASDAGMGDGPAPFMEPGAQGPWQPAANDQGAVSSTLSRNSKPGWEEPAAE